MATSTIKATSDVIETTLSSQYATNLSIRRIGDFKQLHIGTIGTDTGLKKQDWSVICTLPAAYRPHWEVLTKAVSNALENLYPFLIKIETNGTFSIYNYSNSETHLAITHDFLFV